MRDLGQKGAFVQRLDDIMFQIHAAETSQVLWDVLAAYFRSIGVVMASYYTTQPSDEEPVVRREGFPETWTCKYIEENLVQIDPVPELASRSASPFYWHELDELAPTTEDAQRYLALMKQANIGDGLVFYVFGPALRNAYVALGFGPERLELSPESIWAIQCVAQAGHLRACVLRKDELHKLELSKREHEILRWLARGKSNSVIASILSVSPHTIDAHVRRIYSKLNVNDRTSAVIKGIGSGLIKI